MYVTNIAIPVTNKDTEMTRSNSLLLLRLGTVILRSNITVMHAIPISPKHMKEREALIQPETYYNAKTNKRNIS